jgi:regulatory protein
VRIVSFQEGTRGTVKIGSDAGSFFLFRLAYLSDAACADPSFWARAAEACAEIPEAMAADIAAACAATAAERLALSRLALRERTRTELERYLERKEHEAFPVKRALDRLEEEGLLSDKRFAEAWIRHRLSSRPEGPILLRSRLAAKGVGRELAAGTVKENADAVSEGLRRAASSILRKESRQRGIEGFPIGQAKRDLQASIYKKLRQRGFSHPEVRTIIKEMLTDSTDFPESDGST